jgi:hypothetical protein
LKVEALHSFQHFLMVSSVKLKDSDKFQHDCMLNTTNII